MSSGEDLEHSRNEGHYSWQRERRGHGSTVESVNISVYILRFCRLSVMSGKIEVR